MSREQRLGPHYSNLMKTRYREKVKPAHKPVIFEDDDYCMYCEDIDLCEDIKICEYCGGVL